MQRNSRLEWQEEREQRHPQQTTHTQTNKLFGTNRRTYEEGSKSEWQGSGDICKSSHRNRQYTNTHTDLLLLYIERFVDSCVDGIVLLYYSDCFRLLVPATFSTYPIFVGGWQQLVLVVVPAKLVCQTNKGVRIKSKHAQTLTTTPNSSHEAKRTLEKNVVWVDNRRTISLAPTFAKAHIAHTCVCKSDCDVRCVTVRINTNTYIYIYLYTYTIVYIFSLRQPRPWLCLPKNQAKTFAKIEKSFFQNSISMKLFHCLCLFWIFLLTFAFARSKRIHTHMYIQYVWF